MCVKIDRLNKIYERIKCIYYIIKKFMGLNIILYVDEFNKM